jgi:hypothetical protein
LNLWNVCDLLVSQPLLSRTQLVPLYSPEPLKIGERLVTDREKMLGMSGISLLAVFFMSSAGSVIFSAMGVSLIAIGAHSAVGLCTSSIQLRPIA